MKSKRLTPSLDQVEAFIRSEINAGKKFPTQSAIARHMGWRNSCSASDALRKLAYKNRLVAIESAYPKRKRGTYRTYHLPESSSERSHE